MNRIINLISSDPEAQPMSAILCDSGKFIFNGMEFMDLVSFQAYLKKQTTKYMIVDE